MRRSGVYACLAAVLSSASAQAGTVSISPSASTVAEGGTLTFTVTVTPGTYVQRVILAYQGESGQDEDTTSPYVFTHQFNTPMDNLAVTATAKYSNGDPDDTATIYINVVGISITGKANPTRGWPTTYTAQSNPAGKAIDQFNWSYDAGVVNTYQDNDVDGDDKSSWSGTMVVAGTLRCTAVVSGVSTEKSVTITITPRNWTIPITCAQDNEADWGDVPVPSAILGRNRDRDSDIGGYVFVPRNSQEDFTPARTLAMVSTGPCAGWWYVSSSTLKCQRETVINKYIKSTGPALGGTTFMQANADCFSSTPADFLQAVKNHEYRGTPNTLKSEEGHQGRIEKTIRDFSDDAKQHIEPLTDRTQAGLSSTVDSTIVADEGDAWTYAADEIYMSTYGPNWGSDPGSLGAGQNSRWDGSAWTSCIYGPDDF